MKKKLLQLKFEVRSMLAREPHLSPLHRLVIWWTQRKMQGIIDVRECRVGPHTDLVIDGFQGSGNSFATRAFKRSQSRPVMVAHHLHAPAQIIEAVKQGVPTLVTIREPAGAALSLTSRWPYVSVSQALRSYIHFYEKIEPYATGYVLSSFEQTTKHLGEIIRSVNRRFGESFDAFEYKEEDMRILRRHNSSSSTGKAERQGLKDEKARAFEQAHGQQLLKKAEALYRRLEPFRVGEREPERASRTADHQ